MATIKNLIDEIILEKKEENLTINYDIDTFIQSFKKTNEEENLNEEVYKNQSKGEINVSAKDAKSIQTVEDLLDFLTDQKEDILNELEKEAILLMMELKSGKALSDLLSEGDKIIAEVTFGNSEEDNIGFRINKRAGTQSYTVSLIKNNQIVPSKFNVNALESQIVYYRNSVLGS